MARSIDQITAELNKYTDSTRQNILSALAELPTQQAAQESGLRAQLADANDQILAGARRRGLGFSGIPLGEQAKYAATEFAPALARNAAQFSERRMTLQDALSNLDRQNYLQANDIYNQELQREEQKRQFDLNYALQQQQAGAAAAQQQSLASLYNQSNKQPQNALTLPGITLKDAKAGGAGGYAFTFGNQPASAAQFAQYNGLNIADLLFSMANAGDATAVSAYRDIVNNGGQITPNIANKYSSLFWGTNLGGSPQRTAQGGGGGGW